MWLNNDKTSDAAIAAYRKSLLNACPNHIVIDDLFNVEKLNEIATQLKHDQNWQTQKHTYDELYVDNDQWNSTSNDQRFVQRDIWQRTDINANNNIAQEFLSFLRNEEFLTLLSRIFNVKLTDINVEDPSINTNYFRLSATDFVAQHADDSPGREVCMLIYLNQHWNHDSGGELAFSGKELDQKNGNASTNTAVKIPPIHNRCVLFDPFSTGSEHWVEKINPKYVNEYRYNITSWYWSE